MCVAIGTFILLLRLVHYHQPSPKCLEPLNSARPLYGTFEINAILIALLIHVGQYAISFTVLIVSLIRMANGQVYPAARSNLPSDIVRTPKIISRN